MSEAADTDAGPTLALGRGSARPAEGPRRGQVRAALAADRAHWRRRAGGDPRLRRGYHAVWLYRMSRHAHERGWRMAAWLLWLVNGWWTGADIPPSSRIAGGLYLPFPSGAIIAGTVGRDAAFGPQASIGGLLRAPTGDIGGGPGLPVLGDGVTLEPGAIVLGLVRIGDGVRLGPNVIMLKDAEDGAEVMPPAWRALPGRAAKS